MAEATASRSVFDLPGLRQLFLLVGLAGAIAAGLWLVFWSQGPNYSTLYSQLSERETAQVVDALQAAALLPPSPANSSLNNRDICFAGQGRSPAGPGLASGAVAGVSSILGQQSYY